VADADARRRPPNRAVAALNERGSERLKFLVEGKQFLWAWRERVDPRRARIPSSDVIAVRVRDDEEKQALLALDAAVFFTEPHYDGYNAVLVRLPAIDPELLTDVVTAAWQCRASREVSGRGERI
jgi:hypothetical protein